MKSRSRFRRAFNTDPCEYFLNATFAMRFGSNESIPVNSTRANMCHSPMSEFSLVLDSTPEEIQAIRRACFELVPTMAIQICEIRTNGSFLKPEILMQRLASIPIQTDANSFCFKEECECESFCPRCSIRGTISHRAGSKTVVVKSDEIPRAIGGIPIVALVNQEIDLDWVALKGTGRQSAHHCPVSVVIARDGKELKIESIHYPAKIVFKKALESLATFCDKFADALDHTSNGHDLHDRDP